MNKPNKCSRCDSTELTYREQYPIFDPDTEEEEIHNCWICDKCETIHVENDDYFFYIININTNKTLQLHDDCTIV